MRTKEMMNGLRGSTWALVLGVLLCGAAAQAQESTRAARVTTTPLPGDAGDTVVVSVVDAGVRTGARVPVTLQLVDGSGTVVARTSGVVSEGVPLRLTYRAPSSAGLSAQTLIPTGPTQLSAPVVVVERWNPTINKLKIPIIVCAPPMVETDPEPEPVSDCHVEYVEISAR